MWELQLNKGWNTEPFEIAYQACLDANLVLSTQIKKRKMSPIENSICPYLHIVISIILKLIG